MRRPRVRMRLASRFTLTFGLMILVMSVGIGLVVEHHLGQSRLDETKLRLAGLARNLATICRPYLMNYDYVTLQRVADDAHREPGITRVLILDKEGLIAGWSGQRERQGQQAVDPISLRAATALEPFEVRRQASGGAPLMDRIEPVFGPRGAARWGTVYVSLSLQAIQDEARETRILILQFAMAGILLAVIGSHLLARRVTRSLGLLVERASGLARGDWDTDFRLETGDEIEELGNRFQETAESLERQHLELVTARDELASLNATLEEKVRERTRELVESREKYRLLVDASPDPLCLIQKGRFRFVNRVFLETFGYTEEQVASDEFSIEKVVHPDFAAVALEVLEQAEKSDDRIDTDWVGVGRGGRTLDLSVRGRRVQYQGSPAVELLWIDHTDKKRLLRQVVQNERMRAIGEMTAMVAHNFNNLLAVILGRTQLLQAKTGDATIRRGLEIIRTAALQGGEIVRRIQDYTIESTEVQAREVNISSVVRDVCSYLENYWRVTRGTESGPIQLDLDVLPTPPVLGSESLLTDVFKHVLVNAAEAMPGGGKIRVEVRATEEAVRVLVEDSGMGMTIDVMRRAFDPFFTTKGRPNRGLGLSASHGIVQRHRGKIELRSCEEGGSTVEITLPIHKSGRTDAPAADPSVVVLSEEQKTARRLRRTMTHSPSNRSSGGSAAGDGPGASRQGEGGRGTSDPPGPGRRVA